MPGAQHADAWLLMWSPCAGALAAHLLESLIEVPVVALSLWIINCILGEVALLEGSSSGRVVAWRLVAFSALFTALFGWLQRPIGMALHTAAVWLWKWGVVGRMSPGVDLTSSTLRLLGYAVLRRLVETPIWEEMQELLTGTPIMGALYRALGAKVGRQVSPLLVKNSRTQPGQRCSP